MKYSLSPRDFLTAQALLHGISQLESYYKHYHLSKNGFAAAVTYVAVTAVAANEDPALAVMLITSVEEILAAMVTRSLSHSHSHSHSHYVNPPSIHSSIHSFIH